MKIIDLLFPGDILEWGILINAVRDPDHKSIDVGSRRRRALLNALDLLLKNTEIVLRGEEDVSSHVHSDYHHLLLKRR